MKAKLIKTDVNYLLEDNKGVVIGSTSTKEINKLSKQNCDEIFGIVDVEKLAKEDADLRFSEQGQEDSWLARNTGIVWGFNKAMELNKDKVFTESDIRKAIEYGIQSALQAIPGVTSTQSILENFIQQPTEIEVEIEMKKVVDETKVIGAVKGVKGSGDKITTYKSIPKLDSNGCLILKRYEA